MPFLLEKVSYFLDAGLLVGRVCRKALHKFFFPDNAAQLPGKTVNLAVKVEDDIIALVAVREVVALDLHRLHEGGAVAGVFPARGNIGLALLRGDAAAFLLLALAKIFRTVVKDIRAAVFVLGGPHALG